MSKPPGPIVLGVLAHLAEHGATSAADIARALGENPKAVASVCSRLNRSCLTLPKRIYVFDYAHEDDGARRYPRALYALGNKRDKPKPKRNRAAAQKRYRERNKSQVTSVFDLARKGRGQRPLIKGLPTCLRL